MQSTRRGVLGLFAVAGTWPSQALAGKRISAGRSPVKPHELRVEWLQNPTGIDTLRPRFSWFAGRPDRDARNVRQAACRIRIASTRDGLRRDRSDVWDSGKQETSEMRFCPPGDLALRSQTQYWWCVKTWDATGLESGWSAPSLFVTGIVSPQDWTAQWIAAEPDPAPMKLPPTALDHHDTVEPKPLPVFRRDVTLSKRITSAIVCVTGLGHYELMLNGRPVTTGKLNPGWTNYRKTVLYNTFDVTHALKRGTNALAVMLGNGMYNVEQVAGRYTKFVGSFGQPKMILQLKIAFADGSESMIASDASWRTHPGPITFSSAYNEDFDARRISSQWSVATTEGWSEALAVNGPGGALRAQNIPPVVEAKIYKPISVKEPKPGIFVYDFGQNMSGWPKLVVKGPAGSRVKMMPSELLADDGLVNPLMAGARHGLQQCYNYTLGGGSKEAWHPQFSYYGFRYIQVEGAAPARAAKPGVPAILSLETAFLHTDLDLIGAFDCSDTLFTRIHRLIKVALLSNTFSVLTDCPHREKLGWLEQTYLNADTVFCNEDAVTLYEKMINDVNDSQTPEGMVPGTAPEYVAFIKKDGTNEIWRDSPEWGAAVVLSPLATYSYYGDRRILETGYPAMKRYAAYLESKMKDGVIAFGMGDWYDVGSQPPGPAQFTTLALTSTASYYAIVNGIAKTAGILGQAAEAELYARKAEETKRIFNEKIFNPATGGYDTNSQTSNAMPLALGLAPEERRAKVLGNLVKDIRAHNNHVTAGDVGFHYLVLALMENGRSDVLSDMLSRTDNPSYGYQLAKGATSLTEAWGANKENSQNHFMLGHAETFFYRGLCGINIDMTRNGAERIRIAPQTVSGVAGVSGKYRSALGEIISTWSRANGTFKLFAAVPPGTQAKIVLPSPSAGTILESGKALSEAAGVLAVESANGTTTVTVGSGDYRFAIPAA